MPGMGLYTVGHSSRTLEELVALLRAHGIRRLVDVRRFPGSRRHPQFGREALAQALTAAGITYEHAEALGGRRRAAPDSPNDAWRNASFRGYADHMGSSEFRRALDDLLRAAVHEDVAAMCAEAVPWRCHRNLIADAAVARGIAVAHILTAERADPHRLSAHARVQPDGSLVYPAGGAAQPDLFGRRL